MAATQAPRAPGAAQGIVPSQSPSFSLPLRFFLLAIGAGPLAFGGLVAVAPDLAAGTSWSPHLLAVLHLFTLGVVLASIQGATYQMIPVVLLAPIRSEVLGKLGFWPYLVGLAAFVAGSWAWQPRWLAAGAALVGLGLLAFLVNVALSLGRQVRTREGAAFALSGACLAGAWTLGAWRAQVYAGHAPASPAELLAVHAHLAAFGGATILVFGLSYRLIPMFALSHGHDRFSRPVLALAGAGVAAFAAGGLLGVQAAGLVGAAAMLGATGLWLVDAWRMFRGRVRRRLDAGLAGVAIAPLYLALGGILGGVLALGALPSGRATVAYGLLGLVGWLGGTITGQLHKILPFLAWYHRFSSHVGRGKVPLLKELYDERLAWAGLGASQIGLVLAVAGVLAGQATWVQSGGVALMASALATAALAGQVLVRKGGRRC